MRAAKTLTFSALGCVAVAIPMVLRQQSPVIRPNTFVGPIALGGLTPDQARFKIRAWWNTDRLNPVRAKSDKLKFPSDLTPARFGVTVDDEATIANLPLADLPAQASGLVGQEPEPLKAPLLFKVIGEIDPHVLKELNTQNAAPSPAQVKYSKGAIFAVKEKTRLQVDAKALQAAVMESLPLRSEFDVPVIEAPKVVPDDQLSRIKHVIGSYSTNFSAGNRPRSRNIQLAASFFDGRVLMPGQSISYNDTVGRRTTARGFKPAGVYINGRHDTGIGGGICQVSTTLYNAALFANLGIKQRQCHSLPVPYVPLGRDATVDYGNIDLVLVNTTEAPIAIVSEYKPGSLTFRVLGEQVPGQKVKVSQGKIAFRDRGVRTVVDRRLAPGARRVIESGSAARSVSSWRTVFKGGKIVKTEPLGTSYYGGSSRIVAVGPSGAPKPAQVRVPTVPSGSTDSVSQD
jgi:vancomycin resistance protein YoaR